MRLFPLLLLCVIACGDDGVRHTPDAAPHDGPASIDAPDAPGGDAAVQPVAVTVTTSGAPLAGVHVYFQNADSTLVLATTTDATGTASAVMAAGGSVTVVDGFGAALTGGFHILETVEAVKPGDHLYVASPSGGGTSINVTIQAPLDAAASSYMVFSPCNSGGTTVQTPVLAAIGNNPSGTMTLTGCGATTDFLVVSYDGNNQPLNYTYATNVAIADQGTVDLTASTYAGVTTRTLTYMNAMQSLDIEDDLIDPMGKIYASLNETPSDETMPVLTELVPSFTGAADLLQTIVPGNLADQTLLDWGPYTDTFTTDLATRLLPAYSDLPTFDPATHTASIPEAATGVTPDFTVVGIETSRASDNTTWAWLVAAPHGASIALPVVPTDLYDFNIASTDSYRMQGWATGKVPGGYDAARPYILTTNGVTDFASGPTGSATVEEWSQPPPSRTAPRTAPRTLQVFRTTRRR